MSGRAQSTLRIGSLDASSQTRSPGVTVSLQQLQINSRSIASGYQVKWMPRWPGYKKWVLDLRLNSRIERLRIPAIIVGATRRKCGDDDDDNQYNDATGKQREVCPKWAQGIQCYKPVYHDGCFCTVQEALNHAVFPLGPTMNGALRSPTRSDTSTRSWWEQVFKNIVPSSATEMTRRVLRAREHRYFSWSSSSPH